MESTVWNEAETITPSATHWSLVLTPVRFVWIEIHLKHIYAVSLEKRKRKDNSLTVKEEIHQNPIQGCSVTSMEVAGTQSLVAGLHMQEWWQPVSLSGSMWKLSPLFSTLINPVPVCGWHTYSSIL